jgi:hypothetical protein
MYRKYKKWIWAGIIVIVLACGYWQKDNVIPSPAEQTEQSK